MHKCNNVIVNTCIQEAKTNSNSPLGYKFAFFRNKYGINDVNNVNVNKCVKSISGFSKLSDNKLTVVRNLCTLINVNSGNYCIDGFNNVEISEMINTIAVL